MRRRQVDNPESSSKVDTHTHRVDEEFIQLTSILWHNITVPGNPYIIAGKTGQ